MVNGWFGLVVWISGIPVWKGLLLKGTLRIPNHRAPNQQLIISWGYIHQLFWFIATFADLIPNVGARFHSIPLAEAIVRLNDDFLPYRQSSAKILRLQLWEGTNLKNMLICVVLSVTFLAFTGNNSLGPCQRRGGRPFPSKFELMDSLFFKPDVRQIRVPHLL